MAEKTTIEESLKELDAIVAKLESREISLEDSFALYQKGMELLKECSKKIDTVEKKMLKMNENGELSEF
ncbi:MAG: exodeoxyribonuclease VII small subunit [Blautia sp.]|nr:exodeoxyribonuclease VII small subunit [Blautia sp.]MDD7371686.1 exodeoxyribonuclease VII small subunit [Bacillota bacterium]MDY3715949.1 exodeoxyribonuclease VII small subunit [Blautia sp.]